MAQHLNIGRLGEDKAAEYLLSKGFEIVELNWRWKHKEVDIIAKHNNCLVFVEVKSQTSNTFKNPVESVTQKKQKNLIEAANAYCENNAVELELRFDVISIIIQENKPIVIEHFEDAFFPEIEML